MAEKEYIAKEFVIDAIEELKTKPMPKALLFDHLTKLIEIFPTDNFVPVKHGHWISLDDYFEDAECSECGDALVIGDCSFNDFCECYNYCPNCGAKMDGGDNE